MRLPLTVSAILLCSHAWAQVPVTPSTSAIPGADMATTIVVAADARVERVPDLAEMSAGVVAQAPSAGEASRANAERMTAVIAALRRAGVAERDIQTSTLSLQPQYDYQERQAPRLVAYQASNMVTTRLRDLTRAGVVIDALVAAGANQINGPNFRIDDEDAALDSARTAAVVKARRRADLYARALGMRVRRVVSLSEGTAERPPFPVVRARMMASQAESTPVEPGEVALTASVVVTFELE